MTAAPPLGSRALRAARAHLSAVLARFIEICPGAEPAAIAAGRAAAKRSRVLAGLYWFVQESLLARLRPRHGKRYRTVEVRGRRLQLDITDTTGRLPYFYRTPYEPGATDAILTALGPGDAFVDVGANIGYFSVLAATVVGPAGLVVAFEPHEGARLALDALVRRNGMTARVEAVASALADADGDATLFVDDAVSAHSTIEPSRSPMRHVAPLRSGLVVPVTTLDGWLAGRPDVRSRVRCVKIDVEGAEHRVLVGMPLLLRADRLTVVCETVAGGPADELLHQAGFQRRRIESGASPVANFLYVRP